MRDRWTVVGQITEEQDRLRVRRTWLVGGSTGRRALLLDFAAGGQPMEAGQPLGSAFEGELAFYPSRLGLRALVKTRDAGVAAEVGRAADRDVASALQRYAEALALDPWLARWPFVLSSVVPALADGRWMLIDGAGAALPLRPGYAGAWRLLSVSGGRPVTVSGEWDGEFLLPLAVDVEDLAPRWAA